MPSLEEFNQLSDREKAEAIWQGNFLADREENGLIVQLYSLCDFYVEVYYDGLANKILRFRPFKNTSQLTPYIAHIKFNMRSW